MYVLNLAKDNRILSASVALGGINYDGKVIVDELPDDTDGKWVTDYYYENGEYRYDPLPRPEEPENQPSQLDIIEAQVTYTAMMTDTLLEEV